MFFFRSFFVNHKFHAKTTQQKKVASVPIDCCSRTLLSRRDMNEWTHECMGALYLKLIDLINHTWLCGLCNTFSPTIIQASNRGSNENHKLQFSLVTNIFTDFTFLDFSSNFIEKVSMFLIRGRSFVTLTNSWLKPFSNFRFHLGFLQQ